MPRYLERACSVAVAAVSMLWFCTPALAIDCTKAKTQIERAICSDNKLGNLDGQLEKAYASVIQSAKDSEFRRANRDVRSIRAGQTQWVAEREKACGRKPGDQLLECVLTWTAERIQWLFSEFRPKPGDTLAIGAETLVVDVMGQGRMLLKHGGEVVVDVDANFSDVPFTVLQRASGPGGTAVFLEAGAASGDHCSTIYLIWTGKAGLQSRDVGLNCISFDSTATNKTDRGLTFMQPAAPSRDGMTTDWDARSGEVSGQPVHFQPTPGTTMLGLFSSGNAGEEEPLKNQEFFDAVGKLPVADRERLMGALWQITDDCSTCLDEAGRAHYGVIVEQDGVTYSGCGIVMSGGYLHCGEFDALAIWEKKSGSFHFALSRHQKPGGVFPPVSLGSFPPKSQWSDYAKARFQLWDRGAGWVKRGD